MQSKKQNEDNLAKVEKLSNCNLLLQKDAEINNGKIDAYEQKIQYYNDMQYIINKNKEIDDLIVKKRIGNKFEITF